MKYKGNVDGNKDQVVMAVEPGISHYRLYTILQHVSQVAAIEGEVPKSIGCFNAVAVAARPFYSAKNFIVISVGLEICRLSGAMIVVL
jgi:hypothetical protein